MSGRVAFPLEDGGTVVVTVDEQWSGGTVRAGRAEIIEKSQNTFEDAMGKIYFITERAIRNAILPMRHLSLKPSEIEIELGFDLSPEFGVAIARSSDHANCKVTLRWSAQEET